ncbi:hypothetical protein L596_029943 [Steinernema carpocapsae]|uniref:Uncharacterized protein n=1 Tax=Steinernema carpocapsae TaxID=34508 RepID=A0A4U5LRA4_STECR|nr:hypothetical protein L596_029943 [Steinernema carpocapsae]
MTPRNATVCFETLIFAFVHASIPGLSISFALLPLWLSSGFIHVCCQVFTYTIILCSGRVITGGCNGHHRVNSRRDVVIVPKLRFYRF